MSRTRTLGLLAILLGCVALLWLRTAPGPMQSLSGSELQASAPMSKPAQVLAELSTGERLASDVAGESDRVTAVPAWSQYGSLVGVLYRQDGSPAGGYQLLSEGEHGGSSRAFTQEDGQFRFPSLTPGMHEISLHHTDFWSECTVSLGDVEIQSGISSHRDFFLGEMELRGFIQVVPEDLFAASNETDGQIGYSLRLVPSNGEVGRPIHAGILFGKRAGFEASVKRLVDHVAENPERRGRLRGRKADWLTAHEAGELSLGHRGEVFRFVGIQPGYYQLEVEIGETRLPWLSEGIPVVVRREIDLTHPQLKPLVVEIDDLAEFEKQGKEHARLYPDTR